MKNIESYDDLKLYDISDFINKFKVFYKLDLDEIEDLFNNYNILSWSEVEKYLMENGFNNREITDKYSSYLFYEKSLDNLKTKGLVLISILRYLVNSKKNLDCNDSYEDLLDSVGIYHYSSILKGVDINKISIVIYHLVNSFNFYLDKINSLDTYLGYGIDKFALIYGGDRIFPNRDLAINVDNYEVNLFDKTSLHVKKKVRTKNDN